MSLDAFERRLLALERRVRRLPTLDLERRAAALEQSLAQSWSWSWGGTAPPPVYDPTLVYIGLRCWGEDGVPSSGCPVTIADGSGTTRDAGLTDGVGVFVSIGLPPAFYYATTSARARTRFQTGATFTATGTVTWMDALVYATGTTLTLSDAEYGNATLSWDGSQWSGTHVVAAVAACNTCAGAVNVPVLYTYANTAAPAPSVQYLGGNATGCPVAAGTAGARYFLVPGLVLGPQTYAGGLDLRFNLPAGSPGNPLYCRAGTAVTITQP